MEEKDRPAEKEKRTAVYFQLRADRSGYDKIIATDSEPEAAPAPQHKPKRKRKKKQKPQPNPSEAASSVSTTAPKKMAEYVKLTPDGMRYEKFLATDSEPDEPVQPQPKPKRKSRSKAKKYTEEVLSDEHPDYEGGSSDEWIPPKEDEMEGVKKKSKPMKTKKKPPVNTDAKDNTAAKIREKIAAMKKNVPNVKMRYSRAEGRPFVMPKMPPLRALMITENLSKLSELADCDVDKLSEEELKEKMMLLQKYREDQEKNRPAALQKLLDLILLPGEEEKIKEEGAASMSLEEQVLNEKLKEAYRAVDPLTTKGEPTKEQISKLAGLLMEAKDYYCKEEGEKLEESDMDDEDLKKLISALITKMGLDDMTLETDEDTSSIDSSEEIDIEKVRRMVNSTKPIDIGAKMIAMALIGKTCDVDNLTEEFKKLFTAEGRKKIFGDSLYRKSYKCTYTNCDFTAITKGKIEIHLTKSHGHQKKVLTCLKCDFETIYLGDMKKHALVHGDPDNRRFKCYQVDCHYSTPYKQQLANHTLKVHGIEPEGIKMHRCDVCNYSTSYANTMKRHKEAHGPRESKTYKCYYENCSYASAQRGHLKIHMASVHKLEEYSFKCDKCNYQTGRKQLLNAHMGTVHKLGEYSYKCDKCSYETGNKQLLNSHMGTVHKLEEYSHKCDKCSYETGNKQLLNAHMGSVHKLGEYSHKCDKCSHETGTKQLLNSHMGSVHNEQKYLHTCPTCSYYTGYKSDLKKHIRNKHNNV